MLFRRMIDPSCAYCRYGSDLGGGEIACLRRGITAAGGSCKKFKYDPLKRTPERPERNVRGLLSDAPEAALTAEQIVESAAALMAEQAKALDDKLTSALSQEFRPQPATAADDEKRKDGSSMVE